MVVFITSIIFSCENFVFSKTNIKGDSSGYVEAIGVRDKPSHPCMNIAFLLFDSSVRIAGARLCSYMRPVPCSYVDDFCAVTYGTRIYIVFVVLSQLICGVM